MSWLFSRALVEEYSGVTFSDGEPSAPLSASPTPQAYCSPDKMTACSRLFRFGMTFAPLTDALGEALLMSFLADFLVRTSAAQEKGLASTESAQGSGEKWHGSLARYDRDSCSWKTHQYSLLGGLTEFSETWPRWGLMRNGELFPLKTLVPHIDEKESGLWQTPVADDSVNRKKGKWNSRGEPKLSAQVLWPTPCANETGENPEKLIKRMKKYGRTGSDVHMKLSTYIQMWPTPTTQDNVQVAGMGKAKGNSKRGTTLGGAVRIWPTPTATFLGPATGEKLAQRIKNRKRPSFLSEAIVWPTPTTSEAKSDTLNIQNRINKGKQIMLCHAVRMKPTQEVPTPQHGGSLNPMWVEWLMGWPLGWTDLKPLAMDKFHSWRQQLLNCSPENKK
jgi:hypothetical protein